MFDKVLVGVDEQTHGLDAVALARRLVSPGGKLILAHVHPGSSVFTRGADELDEFAHHASVRLLRAVVAESGVDAETRCAGTDRIANGLHRLAEEASADLLVLGSSHEGQHGRVWLRDQVRRALNGAPCAVAVAPLAYAELGTPITQVGIAYNGSRESRAALRTGQALASQLGAEALAFQALRAPVAGDSQAGGAEQHERLRRAAESEARERVAAQTGISACTSCGDTVEQLSIFSGTVDLLVVGSRDYGPVGRLVHSSTTHRLLGHARSPLLILTRAARARVPAQAARSGELVAV